MSSGANGSGTRWPDVAVGVGGVLLIAVLGWVALGPARPPVGHQVAIQYQLRTIHQAALLHGLENNNYLAGLNADGSLLTNDPAERYELLIDSDYLTADLLISPADARPDAAYSYALLDLGSPGARRDAWTTDAAPDAPILAESPAALGLPAASPTPVSGGGASGGWSGWVLWHSAYLTADTAARSTELADSPRLRTRYADTGPFNEDDDLFAAAGPDDAHLISADR